MPIASFVQRAVLLIPIALFPAVVRGQTPATGPTTATSDNVAAARGVHCPSDFETLFDAATGVLRCRRELVSWVVTSCVEREFATYVAKPGPDGCGPTEIPGVGTPPGARGSRPVSCATSGYAVVPDRTGPRDRCERVERVFAYPRPTS